MKKSIQVKFVAILAVFTLLCQIPVGAVSLGEITTEPMQPIVPKTSLGLPLADIPEVLSAEQTVSAGNIVRLRDQEQAQNSAIFRNADGTNTLYQFSENIWYKDANGEKYDYDTTLTQGIQAGTFMSANAGGNLVLPQSVNATTPISYYENGYTFTMYPTTDSIGSSTEVMGGTANNRVAVAISDEEIDTIATINEVAAAKTGNQINVANLDATTDVVKYFRANKDASMLTSATLHGTKTGILIDSDNGVQNYSFVVDTDGLTPIQSGKTSISLVDEIGDIQSYLNVEEITDSSGNKSFENEIEYLAQEDGKYLITVTPDADFLATADYPSLYYIVYSAFNLEASSINDVDVGTYDPNANYATAAKLYVGRLGGEKYRTYFQLWFPEANQIAPGALVDAYLYLYESSTNTSSFTMDSEIPNSNQWSHTTLTWNSPVNDASTFHDPFNYVYAPTMISLSGSSQYYAIDTTDFVEGALRNYKDDSLPATVHENRGFVFFSLSEDNTSVATHLRVWHSTNHSSNKPYLKVKFYGDFGGATTYRPLTSSSICNCFAYALEISGTKSFPDNFTGIKTEYEIIEAVLSAAAVSVDSIRHLPSKSSFVDYNEYRIAMRMAYSAAGMNSSFHFLVQLNDGSWAQKFPGRASSQLGHIDPDIDGGLGYWSCVPDASVGVTGTYTLYFAVDPTGR